jgi:hypothetical protein
MAARRITALLGRGLSATVITLLLSAAPSGAAQAAARHVPAATRPVKALLIFPYGGCNSSAGWRDLAADWSMFGTTPLKIATLCSGQVSYAGLVASKAHVLVFSDVAGGNNQLSGAEISAIKKYVQAGHNIVGTYITFLWKDHGEWDNTGLAPLFGLSRSFTGGATALKQTNYKITLTGSPLFTSVPNPYGSTGFASSQTPAAGLWNTAALSGARYAAHTAHRAAAITLYTDKTDHYRAVYISSMPEFSNPSTADLQFLYNALTLAR